MQTCPACGKENSDDVKQCTTCYEELSPAEEAAPAATAGASEDHEPAEAEVEKPSSQPDESEDPAEVVEEKAADKAVSLEAILAQETSEKKMEAVDEKVAEEAPRFTANPTTMIKEPLQPTAQADGHRGETFTPGTIKLVVEQGLSINKEYLLNDPELIVGRRDPEQEFIPDIDLFDQENANNRYISRRQARIFFKEGGLFVEDLDSSNGTVVNNRPIKPNIEIELHPGDKLLFGQSVMFRVRNLAH